jgi:glycosyltransferase involved in cell wall biosynthesis
VGLLAHYLPSLLTAGEKLGLAQLTLAERAALQTASHFLVPSRFMGAVIRRLAGDGPPIIWVEPGRASASALPLPAPPVRALLVAHLVPGKGVAPFLAALAEHLAEADDFSLRVVGGSGLDPHYAQRCLELAGAPRLRDRVKLLGELSPADTLRAMASSNLLISASRMESYGMALAEARGLGLPILARRGGNVANLVEAAAGGELVSDETELAIAGLRLARAPARLRRRLDQARARALPPRCWADAGRDFASPVAKLRATVTPGAIDGERRPHARSA